MLNHVLSSDAQVTLLLCASFGQNRNIQPQPLTIIEYNIVANFLIKNQVICYTNEKMYSTIE